MKSSSANFLKRRLYRHKALVPQMVRHVPKEVIECKIIEKALRAVNAIAYGGAYCFWFILRASSCRMTLCWTFTVMNAKAMPRTAPKRTSVGKCTNRYRRLKPMSAAAIITQIPDFLKYRRIEVAAAKAHAVCVDGQE